MYFAGCVLDAVEVFFDFAAGFARATVAALAGLEVGDGFQKREGR